MSAVPGFGEPASATLAPALDSARIAAGDAAFAAVAWVTALLCVLSAAAAWISVPGEAMPWPRYSRRR